MSRFSHFQSHSDSRAWDGSSQTCQRRGWRQPRGPRGHWGIMMAAVRAPVPRSSAPHVGTAGSTGSSWLRGSFLPCDLSCGGKAASLRPPPHPTPARPFRCPQSPSQQSERPKASLNLWPTLGTTRNTCLSAGSSAAPRSGRSQGPPWLAQQPTAEGIAGRRVWTDPYTAGPPGGSFHVRSEDVGR